ncbi:hypothetical protein [Staphylococcus shinii]|uniref:hypothetical protein n=1 Tax=Staphylococcus shinii TaxID=2912228 RepID=UPI003F83A103
MASSIQNINELNYSDKSLYRSYHKDLANLRIEDFNIDSNIKLRDEYFKLIEDTGYSKKRNDEMINIYSSEVNNNVEDIEMSAEDRAILKQERRDDPTIDDGYESEMSQKHMYHLDIDNKFNNILNDIDYSSKEYQDIQKVEELITKLSEDNNIKNYEFIDEISLTNSDLDNDINIQIKDEKVFETSYNKAIINNDLNLNTYPFNQEYLIDKKLDIGTNEIETDDLILKDNKELSSAINFNIQASVQEELIRNSSNENFVEIRNNNNELQNKLNEFNDYFNNNQGKIIEENKFEEGYNHHTGSIESIETLLNDYKIDKEARLREDAYYSLTQDATNELSKEDSLNYDQAMSSTIFDDYPYVEDDIKDIKKDISELGKENQHNLKSIDVNINPKDNSYTITGINSSNEKSVFTGEIPNITKEFNKNYSLENKVDSTQQISDLQKLKSVELEKNVIGLLPKEQQENNYKDTLSRLDKNKSSLKEDLKSYMSNTKIDNIINSVKEHFENIKVKAEDINQNFKDLGSWNRDNNFVKNIDNVINSVKELGKKHESELLNSNQDSIMNKLNNEYIELKDYLNKADLDNDSFVQQNEIRDKFVNNMLDSKQIKIDFEPEDITKDLSENQKAEVYNHLKDMNNHYKNRADTSSMTKERDNNLIIKQLETDNPHLKEHRNEYINLKQSISPIKLETSSEKLNDIIKESNKDISKMNGIDKSAFKENKKEETRISNQNIQSNKIKSNDMFKKMDKLNQQNISEKSEEQSKKKEPNINRNSMTR